MKSQEILLPWGLGLTFGLLGIKILVKPSDLMYSMINTPFKNDKNKCFKAITFDFAMLIMNG